MQYSSKELFEKYKQLENKEIIFKGFVRFNRNSSKIGFLTIFDGISFNEIQIVYKNELDNFENYKNITIGSSVIVFGTLLLTINEQQPFEIAANNIEYKLADDTYPLQKKKHSYEFLREIAHLRPRTKTFQAIFKIRSVLAIAIHEFFSKNDYMYVHSPIITGNDAEGIGETFNVTNIDDRNYEKDFFKKKASLSVSGQLNAEAFAQAFTKTYTFAPTFRAENSNTKRHAAEFWMVEPEVAFFNYFEMMKDGENLIKYCIKKVLTNCNLEIEFLEKITNKKLFERLNDVLNTTEIKKITYNDALNILKKAIDSGINFKEKNIEFGLNFGTEHERYLSEIYAKGPIFVFDYPREIKAFYMKKNEDEKTVKGFDLLVPEIGELIGGSERESDYQTLLESIKEKNLSIDELQWYLDLRKFGMYSSSGFGLGFARFVMFVTGIENIRDVLLWPRTPNNLLF